MKKKLPSWIILMLVCMIVAGVLGAVNYITQGPIRQRSEEAAFAARSEAYPGADEFIALSVPADSGISECYEARINGELAGYVVSLTVNGCKGPIEIQAGFDLSGSVQAVSIGGSDFQETVGLGAKIKEPAFKDQFKTKTVPVALGDDIDSVTGASISSGAVVSGVNMAGAYVSGLIG